MVQVLVNKTSQVVKVKGAGISQSQIDVAVVFLNAAKDLNAPANVTLALITAGIYESSLGQGVEAGSYNPTRQAPLSCPVNSFKGVGLSQVREQAEAFLSGGPHFTSAIAAANKFPNTDQGITDLAAYAEGAGSYTTGGNAQPDYPPSMVVAEARIIASKYGGLSLSAAGIANDGSSTGTSIDDTSPSGFTLGTTNSPDQDMWTTINQLAQERQWYLFSDGETVYLADGPDLLQQDPVETIDRWDDKDKILGLSFSWDNTSFQYTVNRKKPAKRVVRKSVLTKVQSPTSASLQVICPIDKIRAGDIIKLTNCGPGNGKWLVGDATRKVTDIFTDCNLVPPMSPLSEMEAAGAGNQVLNAGQANSGTVLSAIIQEANNIDNGNFPYVWGGGHGQLGVPSSNGPGVMKGFDCSGSVSAVLGYGGLLTSPQTTQTIIPALGQYAVKGRGSGPNYVTIWVNAAEHVFLEINPGRDGHGPQYFGTWIGGDVNAGREGDPAGGPAWYKGGTPASLTTDPTYVPYHVPVVFLQDPLFKQKGGGKPVAPQNTLFRINATGDISSIPAGATGVAGPDGAVFNALGSAYPGLSNDTSVAFPGVISMTTDPTDTTAMCLDVFHGAAQPSDAPAWIRSSAKKSGDGIMAQPIIYVDFQTQDTAIKAALAPLGQQNYRLWARDITGTAHIPSGFNYAACEWTDAQHYHTSQVYPSFFVKPGYGGIS